MHGQNGLHSFYHIERERGDILTTCDVSDHNGKCWRHAHGIYKCTDGPRFLCKMHREFLVRLVGLIDEIRDERTQEDREKIAS